MDADKLVEAVARAIMAAPCRCGCDDDEPETGERMARAALAAVVTAAGLDENGCISITDAEALLRALADVAEAQR